MSNRENPAVGTATHGKSDRIAVVGERDKVFAFSAVGVEVCGAANAQEARSEISRLARENVKIVFLAENFASELSEYLERYRAKAYPAVIPVPVGEGTGFGIEQLRKNMERAIGADILFRDK